MTHSKAKEKDASGNFEQANRLIVLARRINTKTRTRIPKELKRKICKHCYSYLSPTKTSKTKVNSEKKRVEVSCGKCGKKMFYQIVKKK
jgi:ribonuclease P protein subunit RPR2